MPSVDLDAIVEQLKRQGLEHVDRLVEGSAADLEQWGGAYFDALAAAAATESDDDRRDLRAAADALLDQLQEAGRLRANETAKTALRELGEFAFKLALSLAKGAL